MSGSASTDQLLTTSTVARELGCSEASVRKAADLGRLPVQRAVNGTRVYRRQDVDEYRARVQPRPNDPEAA